MKTEPLKKLIAYLAVAASKPDRIEYEPKAAAICQDAHAQWFTDLANEAGLANDGKHLSIQQLDFQAVGDLTPVRVLAACQRFEDEAWDYIYNHPEPFSVDGWRALDSLRAAAIQRLADYKPWPEE